MAHPHALLSEPPYETEKACAFYRDAISLLQRAEFPFLVGGAYALRCYAGVKRDTKDLDVFVRPADCRRALDLFAAAGYATELTDSLWLAKVFCDDKFVDLIFRSGNAIAEVDDVWFHHAREGNVLGLSAPLCPPEETIWSKAFTMERERYDGADILHILLALGPTLDWDRLVARFGDHWRVLFHYLILFGYVYPHERSRIPDSVLRDMFSRFHTESTRPPAAADRLCQGTLLSRKQYNVDIEQWGYQDARGLRVGDMCGGAG